MYIIEFKKGFDKDLVSLEKENNKLLGKVLKLIISIHKTPYDGLGNPEALKGNLSGYWSRRINQKHRLIYRVIALRIELISCYGHYDDK